MIKKNSIAFLLLVSSALLTNACIPALIVGSAAGGYYIAKDQRKVGKIASDAALKTEIKAKFLKDDIVSAIDVGVEVFEGIVTLYGEVPHWKAHDRAISVARSVDGIKDVKSKMHIVNR